MNACQQSGKACESEKDKAKEALNTYFNQTYQNPKEAQAGYQQIQNLLNSTDPNAKEVFNILEGYTQAFMAFGYTEEEAKARAGAYVSAMYVTGGVSAVVASGSLVKQFGKDVAQGRNPTSGNKLDIRLLPDANGKNHSTAVKGDAKIPVDKVELYMRGKASGDLEALQKEYNALKDSQIANQSLFAKDPSNAVKLKQVKDKIHNIETSREMDRVLNNAGITNTPANNSMIMDKLLDSATGVTPANRITSVVVSGDSGSIRIYATWTILSDGSKRLSTVQTGAFK